MLDSFMLLHVPVIHFHRCIEFHDVNIVEFIHSTIGKIIVLLSLNETTGHLLVSVITRLKALQCRVKTWPRPLDTQALDSYPIDLLFLDRYYAMLGDSIEVN